MKEGVHFNYAGIDSDYMGLMNVVVDMDGFFEEPFLAEREIVETTVKGRDKPYFNRVVRAPLTFTLSFAFKDKYNNEKIREVARWLDQDYYKPFFIYDNPSRIYYCILNSSSTLLHNGLKQGYVNIEFRCNAPYAFSPVYVSKEYEFFDNELGKEIEFINNGDLPCKPEMWIKKHGAGDVSIINKSNGGIEFKFTGLANDEIVYVDNEHEYIESSFPLTYRYDNFNDNYLELPRGVNKLFVKGNCTIQFRYRFKLL